MRMTCASRERSDPRGLRRLRASFVTAGRSPPSLTSSGAPIGRPASTAPVTAPCQSSLSTSTTAVGRVASLVAGKTAVATPAASVAASPPLTRIVFFVALEGKPSLAAACESFEVAPSWGGRLGSSPRLHPAMAQQAAQARTAGGGSPQTPPAETWAPAPPPPSPPAAPPLLA